MYYDIISSIEGKYIWGGLTARNLDYSAKSFVDIWNLQLTDGSGGKLYHQNNISKDLNMSTMGAIALVSSYELSAMFFVSKGDQIKLSWDFSHLGYDFNYSNYQPKKSNTYYLVKYKSDGSGASSYSYHVNLHDAYIY